MSAHPPTQYIVGVKLTIQHRPRKPPLLTSRTIIYHFLPNSPGSPHLYPLIGPPVRKPFFFDMQVGLIQREYSPVTVG